MDRESMEKFCCICNGLSLSTHNDRAYEKCQNCGSLERHRALALFLLSMPSKAGKRFCVLQRKPKLPTYLKYMSPIASFEVLTDSGIAKNKREYDTVYHDHLLDGSNTFMNASEYSGLIERTDNLLASGGVQVFSVRANFPMPKPRIGVEGANRATFKEVQLAVHAPRRFGETLDYPQLSIFDPVPLFGVDVVSKAGLSHSANQGVSGHSILLCSKRRSAETLLPSKRSSLWTTLLRRLASHRIFGR